MKIFLIVIGVVIGFIVLNIVSALALVAANGNKLKQIVDDEKKKIISTDFNTLVSSIGEKYKEFEYPAGLLLFKVRYFVTRVGELSDFREGYSELKKIEKVKEGEKTDTVEIVGSADVYLMMLYGGIDFKEIVKKTVK
jgi:hypothetical protein